jgi:hypothetical protein
MSVSLVQERAVEDVEGDGVIADITMGGVVAEVRHLRGVAVGAAGDAAAPGVPAMNPPVLDDLLVMVNLPGDAAGESTMSVQIPLDGQLPAEVVTVEVTATTTTSVVAADQRGVIGSNPLPSVSVSVDLVEDADRLLVSVEVPGSYMEVRVPTVDPESTGAVQGSQEVVEVSLSASTTDVQVPGQTWSSNPDQLSQPYLALHQSYSQWLLQRTQAIAAAASDLLGGQGTEEEFDAGAAYALGAMQQQAEAVAGQVEEGAGLFDSDEGDYVSWLGYDDEAVLDAAGYGSQATDNEGRLLPTAAELLQELVDAAGEPSAMGAPQQQAPELLAVHHRPYRPEAASWVNTGGDFEDADLVNPVLVNTQQYMEPPVDYLETLGEEPLECALGAGDITTYTLEDLAGVSEHLDAPLNFPTGDTLAGDPPSDVTAGDGGGGVMAYGAQVPADAMAESISGLFMGRRRRLRQAVKPAPAPPSPPVVAPASPKPAPPAKGSPSPPPPAKPQSPPPAKPGNSSPPPPPSVILIDPVPPSPPVPSPSGTPATPGATSGSNGTVVLPTDPNAPVVIPVDSSNTTKTNSTSGAQMPTEEQAKKVETKLASEAAAASQQEPVTATMDLRGEWGLVIASSAEEGPCLCIHVCCRVQVCLHAVHCTVLTPYNVLQGCMWLLQLLLMLCTVP